MINLKTSDLDPTKTTTKMHHIQWTSLDYMRYYRIFPGQHKEQKKDDYQHLELCNIKQYFPCISVVDEATKNIKQILLWKNQKYIIETKV